MGVQCSTRRTEAVGRSPPAQSQECCSLRLRSTNAPCCIASACLACGCRVPDRRCRISHIVSQLTVVPAMLPVARPHAHPPPHLE
eukprot:3215769-Prymnesium_polylepis.1